MIGNIDGYKYIELKLKMIDKYSFDKLEKKPKEKIKKILDNKGFVCAYLKDNNLKCIYLFEYDKSKKELNFIECISCDEVKENLKKFDDAIVEILKD